MQFDGFRAREFDPGFPFHDGNQVQQAQAVQIKGFFNGGVGRDVRHFDFKFFCDGDVKFFFIHCLEKFSEG